MDLVKSFMMFIENSKELAAGLLKLMPDPRPVFTRPPLKVLSGREPIPVETVTRDWAASVVSPTTLRMERHMSARVQAENARAAQATVRLVDGSVARLAAKSNASGFVSLRPQRTTAAETKEDHLAEIRASRWRERMRQDLLAIIGGPLIRDPMAKHPAWTITRITHSPDLRHCQVHWSIADVTERQVFKVHSIITFNLLLHT